MADKYNAEGYFSPTEHEAFTRLEKEERRSARLPPSDPLCISALLTPEIRREISRTPRDTAALP